MDSPPADASFLADLGVIPSKLMNSGLGGCSGFPESSSGDAVEASKRSPVSCGSKSVGLRRRKSLILIR